MGQNPVSFLALHLSELSMHLSLEKPEKYFQYFWYLQQKHHLRHQLYSCFHQFWQGLGPWISLVFLLISCTLSGLVIIQNKRVTNLFYYIMNKVAFIQSCSMKLSNYRRLRPRWKGQIFNQGKIHKRPRLVVVQIMKTEGPFCNLLKTQRQSIFTCSTTCTSDKYSKGRRVSSHGFDRETSAGPTCQTNTPLFEETRGARRGWEKGNVEGASSREKKVNPHLFVYNAPREIEKLRKWNLLMEFSSRVFHLYKVQKNKTRFWFATWHQRSDTALSLYLGLVSSGPTT